jgi:hypothetical protein
MSAPNDGGPAFPCETYGIKNGKETTVPTNGMSLRDWFAGQVLAGFCANSALRDDMEDELVAKCCYAIADAMLAARKGGAE